MPNKFSCPMCNKSFNLLKSVRYHHTRVHGLRILNEKVIIPDNNAANKQKQSLTPNRQVPTVESTQPISELIYRLRQRIEQDTILLRALLLAGFEGEE